MDRIRIKEWMENFEYFSVHETLKPILPESSKTLICSPLFGCCNWPLSLSSSSGGLRSLKSREREREREREGERIKHEDASMSATLLEQTRAAHEEVERLEKCVVQELQRDTKSHKERLHQNHRVNNMLLASLASTAKLVCSRVSFCHFFLPF
jgi:TolA-binding protein